MAILRGGRRIGNFDIRVGDITLSRDKSLVDIAKDPRLQRQRNWFRSNTKVSITNKSR